MIDKRSYVSLTANLKAIYWIGGWNGSGLKKCESLDAANNKWRSIAELNYEDGLIGSNLHKNEVIYALCEETSKRFEKLDIKKEGNKW